MAARDWNAFCTDLVPKLLTDWGAGDLAETIGADMLSRTTAFAQSGWDARDVLRGPFIEETYNHEPSAAPLTLLAAVGVIVRCSLLEEAHAHGPVSSEGIKTITTIAAGPLSEWLNLNYNVDSGPPAGVFSGLDVRWPRAWRAISALAEVPDGGRASYRLPDAPIPELPSPSELVEAGTGSDGGIVLSGIDPGFDEGAIGVLRPDGPEFVVVSSLSRLSRNVDKMMRMIELILARGGSILTTNLLIRPKEVHVRRDPLIAPDGHAPRAGLANEDRLSGLHRKVIRQVLQSIEAAEPG